MTRIEFQIRRTVSKELQINTVEDLKNNLDAIWHYCVHDWCRFCDRKLTDKDRKNKHQSRYATAFLWEFVRSVSFSQSPEPPVRLERVKPPPQVNMEALAKQAAGCLLSYCAALCMDSDDFNGHMAESYTVIKEQIVNKYKKNRTEYIRRIETKRNHAHNSLFN